MLGAEHFNVSPNLWYAQQCGREVALADRRTGQAVQTAQLAHARGDAQAQAARDVQSALIMAQADVDVLQNENRALRAENAVLAGYVEKLVAALEQQKRAA